jgi:hypothetical protein
MVQPHALSTYDTLQLNPEEEKKDESR